jgi:hypothetical protein
MRWKQTAARLALAVSMIPAMAAVHTPAIAQSAPKQTTTPAVTGQQQSPYTQVTLTPAIIQTFLTTYPKIRPQIEAIGRKYNVKSTSGGFDGGLGAYATVTAAAAEMNAAVTPYGYPDVKSWLNTTMTVMFSAQWAVMGPLLDQTIAQGQGKVPAGPGLPAGVAATAQAQLQQGAAALAAMKPSDANIAVAKPYAAQIQALVLAQ